MRKIPMILGIMLLWTVSVAAQTPRIDPALAVQSSTFDSDAEGWTTDDASELTHYADGTICVTSYLDSQDRPRWSLAAPANWLGNRQDTLGGSLHVVLRAEAPITSDFLAIIPRTGDYLLDLRLSDYEFTGQWQTLSIPFDTTAADWFYVGSEYRKVTDVEFTSAFADMTAFFLSGGYAEDGDTPSICVDEIAFLPAGVQPTIVTDDGETPMLATSYTISVSSYENLPRTVDNAAWEVTNNPTFFQPGTSVSPHMNPYLFNMRLMENAGSNEGTQVSISGIPVDIQPGTYELDSIQNEPFTTFLNGRGEGFNIQFGMDGTLSITQVADGRMTGTFNLIEDPLGTSDPLTEVTGTFVDVPIPNMADCVVSHQNADGSAILNIIGEPAAFAGSRENAPWVIESVSGWVADAGSPYYRLRMTTGDDLESGTSLFLDLPQSLMPGIYDVTNDPFADDSPRGEVLLPTDISWEAYDVLGTLSLEQADAVMVGSFNLEMQPGAFDDADTQLGSVIGEFSVPLPQTSCTVTSE